MRVGIVIPRHGQTAVARNQLKRRLRDLVRVELLDVNLELDVIVLASKDAYQRTFAELRSEIERAVTILTEYTSL